MGATARDLEKADKLTAKTMAVVRFLVRILRPILHIGFFRRRIDRSLGGRSGTILRLGKQGEHEKAADLAIEAMKEFWDPPPSDTVPNGHTYRWFFMRLAAENLEKCGAHDKLDRLIEWANAETERTGDNQAARSYICFSHSKYLRGDSEAAVRYAEIASEFDETWSGADFVLGQYALILGKGDAQEYLARAVRKDPRILPHIEQNHICQRHPRIIQKLKRIAAEAATIPRHDSNV